MRTALYRHFSADGDLLYVGISLSALNRLGQHADHSSWFNCIHTVSIEHFETRELARQAEYLAIQSEKPKHNIQHKKKDEAIFNPPPTFADDSRKDLVAKILRFDANYTIESVAQFLKIKPMDVRREIERGALRSWELPAAPGLSAHGTPFKPKTFITGFQLIEYLEFVAAKP